MPLDGSDGSMSEYFRPVEGLRPSTVQRGGPGLRAPSPKSNSPKNLERRGSLPKGCPTSFSTSMPAADSPSHVALPCCSPHKDRVIVFWFWCWPTPSMRPARGEEPSMLARPPMFMSCSLRNGARSNETPWASDFHVHL